MHSHTRFIVLVNPGNFPLANKRPTMPTNKHASFRYRVLDQCFCNRGRRKWSLQELVAEVSRYLQEEFGVDIVIGKRTIQGDINVMRSRPPARIQCSYSL